MSEHERQQAEVSERFEDREATAEMERASIAIGLSSSRIDVYIAAVNARTEPFPPQSPQDAAAQAYLEHAYREGRMPGWQTCYLLRAIATPASYDFAREILMDPSNTENPWASAVMSTVAPRRAREDYLAIICDASHEPGFRSRVSDALKQIADPSIVPAVIDAVRERRLGVARASALLRPLAVPSPQLIAWLEGEDEALARMGFAIGMHRDPLEPEVARALRRALKDDRIALSPVERTRVEEKIARVL